MTERTVTRTFGAQSLVAPLRDALVKRPGPAFGRAFDDPAHGFLHAVDLSRAQAEHDALTATLRELGGTIHELGVETAPPPRPPPPRAPRDGGRRRYVLARPRDLLHRPDAAHQRQRCSSAGGAGGRGRAPVRRALRGGTAEADPPPEPDLASGR